MFAVNAGIKSRFLEIKNDFGSIQGSTHEASEYFSPEKKQWIAVDLMYNIVHTKNANGKTLNTVEVKNTPENDSSVKVLQVQGDSLVYAPFAKMEKSFFDFYGREKDVYFYTTTAEKFNGGFLKKIKNYLSKNYWYGCYSDTHIIDNGKFYRKLAALFSLAVTALLTLPVILKKKKNDRV